ncbi:MAG: DNA gyrase subunit A [Verrucomicrobia bacterium]|nr:DNA gyrase subunit A [Verrucomicrobiota bacterium]
MYSKNEKVEKVNVADEMSKSFLDYSMSVIVSRALPDARDGLKPSQRRILFAMSELGVTPTRKHLKCAKIVGETMGNYHPHGDQAIYPTLVHMAQYWAMREMLIEGQGNFGSVEGDPPASMRYTEARLRHLGASLMDDMEKDTVDFVPNYDETREEPTVLPAAWPNLLVNGGTGIAVGMATNIPPHNLGEILDAICAQIDDPEITIDGLMVHVKGPDFPTGCILLGTKPIRQYFQTGKGSLRVRGKVCTEEMKGNREAIVVTEIPYNVNRAELIKRIADLVNEKTLTDISAVRDESTEETRVVIELKRDANPKVVINNLFKHTSLETTFSVAMLAIDHGRPKLLSLKEAIACYIDHRREVVLRRTRFLLRQAEELAEKLEGFLIALAHLDDFIRIIRESRDRDDARTKLLALSWSRATVEKIGILIRSEARLVNGTYRFTERQVNSILDLRLYQLTGLEQEGTQKEYQVLLETIRDLLDILGSEARVFAIIKKELGEIKAKYANKRLTQIVPDEGEISIEDLIANESTVITLTHRGFLKRTSIASFPVRNRGGSGMKGMQTRDAANAEEEDDFVEHLYTATTHDYLMFFTQSGRCYVERVFELPEMGRAAKGRSIANFLQLRPDEKIAATIRITGRKTDEETFSDQLNIVFATKNGIVKKSNLRDFINMRKGGLIAIKIEEGDQLITANVTDGNSEMVLISRQGMSIRFHEDDVKRQSRDTIGVWGIRLEENDTLVAAVLVDNNCTLLVAGENGVGKRTEFEEYRLQARGGKGIITMKTGDKTGEVAGALAVRESDEIMLITTKGKMVRIRARQIRETGRNTMGVKLIELKPGSKLQAIAPVVSGEDDPTEEPAETPDTTPQE